MTAVVLPPPQGAAWSAADRAPLLRWLIFTGATVFAAILLWSYGLIRLMIASDRTYLSSLIALIYVGTSLHCLWRTIVVSREGDAGRRTASEIEGGADFAAVDGPAALAHGLIADHIRDLALKARTQGQGRLDQTLLLRSLADRLRGSNGFGAFASDTLMKLGLLGTIIGFIIMLAPIAGHRRERQVDAEIVDGPDERRDGGGDVYDARRPRRLDPAEDPVLHARLRDRQGVLARRDAYRDARRSGA